MTLTVKAYWLYIAFLQGSLCMYDMINILSLHVLSFCNGPLRLTCSNLKFVTNISAISFL